MFSTILKQRPSAKVIQYEDYQLKIKKRSLSTKMKNVNNLNSICLNLKYLAIQSIVIEIFNLNSILKSCY